MRFKFCCLLPSLSLIYICNGLFGLRLPFTTTTITTFTTTATPWPRGAGCLRAGASQRFFPAASRTALSRVMMSSQLVRVRLAHHVADAVAAVRHEDSGRWSRSGRQHQTVEEPREVVGVGDAAFGHRVRRTAEVELGRNVARRRAEAHASRCTRSSLKEAATSVSVAYTLSDTESSRGGTCSREQQEHLG